MTRQLNAYLIFDGSTRQAMEYYQSVLGGQLDVMTFADVGETGPTPPPDGVMHALLVTDDGFRVMASDGPPGGEVVRGNDFAVALSGGPDDEAALRGWWDAFSGKGTVDVPLDRQVWGAWFGQVTDPWGVAWMFNIESGDQPPS
jgi:PhnB protein